MVKLFVPVAFHSSMMRTIQRFKAGGFGRDIREQLRVDRIPLRRGVQEGPIYMFKSEQNEHGLRTRV